MLALMMVSSRTHTDPCQNLLIMELLSCISGTQVMLQAHTLIYFHILRTNLKTYDKAHH